MKPTLSVAAIQTGTVIDHIPAGQALKIIELLQIIQQQDPITLGMHLPSKRQGLKDLIKIEGRILTEAEASQIAIFAPHATLNFIENYQVTKKVAVTTPDTITGVLGCPNERCITQVEPIKSCFKAVFLPNQQLMLRCKYCEKTFARNEITEYSR